MTLAISRRIIIDKAYLLRARHTHLSSYRLQQTDEFHQFCFFSILPISSSNESPFVYPFFTLFKAIS